MANATWRESWVKRTEVALIAGIGHPLLAGLASTYRFVVEGLEHLQAAEAAGRPIHAFWHGRILPGTVYFRDRGIVVITSENFDGEWIARIIRRFGYGTARGSSSSGAARAMRQLVREVRDRPVAFALDGPRGPARKAQPGAVWLARITGNPIIPFHLEADRHWTLRSWDRTQIPKPFATIALSFDEPLMIPRGAPADALDECGRELERRLSRAADRCVELVRQRRR